MSKPTFLSRLRRNDTFIAVSAFLTERGLDFEVGFGGKHPFVFVKAPEPFRFAFGGTPGDYRSALNTVRDLKRRLDRAN
ncbi:hypothetical protein PMNALOAF_2712 [Methylobacterium adhaesivum]|uniref:Uncharacterized protein n=1 Tax=Methylobacterium adhaesivum TaxID=333297 RepID=A0ABT8BJ05_9HYPH|nr:hypothetical protein [Methylobacterium adhaesivum]MDN3592066.1 hypothetical protein [Methylobacterium adhaesivum]GJD31453.1 hypothetical protein PMNALOAF_2712 [Methylobacterium adhaesivum]